MRIFRAASVAGLVVAVVLVGTGMSAQAQQAEAPLPVPLETPVAKASYAIGRQFGNQISQNGLQGELLDVPALLQGVQDALTGQELRVPPEAIDEAMQELQRQLQQKMLAAGEKNKAEGPKFLKKYQGMEGVKKTASGLCYRVLKAGNGPKPKETDFVKTHYRGRLVDGTVFDSSYEGNEPAIFQVQEVIPGWTEALKMMKVGEKWEIAVPSELAYGESGRPPKIGPHSVLVFEIELLGIEKPLLPPGAAPGAEPTQKK